MMVAEELAVPTLAARHIIQCPDVSSKHHNTPEVGEPFCLKEEFLSLRPSPSLIRK